MMPDFSKEELETTEVNSVIETAESDAEFSEGDEVDDED